MGTTLPEGSAVEGMQAFVLIFFLRIKSLTFILLSTVGMARILPVRPMEAEAHMVPVALMVAPVALMEEALMEVVADTVAEENMMVRNW